MPDTLGQGDPIPSPETICNLDILDLINRIDAIILEIGRCQSHSRHEVAPHDIVRFGAMVTMAKRKFALYRAPPELDLPKYHPRPNPCPAPPVLNLVENPDCQQLIKLWSALRVELAFSDSEERSSSFSAPDAIRIQALLDKIEATVKDIEAAPGLDLPDVDRQDPPGNASPTP